MILVRLNLSIVWKATNLAVTRSVINMVQGERLHCAGRKLLFCRMIKTISENILLRRFPLIS